MLALMVAAAGAAASTALVRGRRCVQLFLLIARQRFCSRGRRACLSPKQAERSAAEVDSRPIQASGAARERVLAPLIVRLPGFQAGPRRAPPSLVVVCIAATRFMGVAGVLGRPLRGGYGECARRLRRARGHVSGDARRRGRRGPHRRGRRGGLLSSYFPIPPPPCLRRSISMCGGRVRPAKRRDEPGDAQLLQDFQRHVQRWPGPVWRVQLAGVKPGLREPARNASTPLNQSLVDAWPRRQ